MAIPAGGYTPFNLVTCPVSSKNSTDDLLYTIVHRYFTEAFPDQQYRWTSIQGTMWRNYNETFRDLLITWINVICEVRGI